MNGRISLNQAPRWMQAGMEACRSCDAAQPRGSKGQVLVTSACTEHPMKPLMIGLQGDLKFQCPRGLHVPPAERDDGPMHGLRLVLTQGVIVEIEPRQSHEREVAMLQAAGGKGKGCGSCR